MFRVLTANGSRTTTELVEMAVQNKVPVKSLSVQNTTLDDVFVHYTGRQLRDELQKSYAFVMPQRPGFNRSEPRVLSSESRVAPQLKIL